jgi:hypothetical protein
MVVSSVRRAVLEAEDEQRRHAIPARGLDQVAVGEGGSLQVAQRQESVRQSECATAIGSADDDEGPISATPATIAARMNDPLVAVRDAMRTMTSEFQPRRCIATQAHAGFGSVSARAWLLLVLLGARAGLS